MTIFGDHEPEDSWDAEDDTRHLVRLLFRMMALLDGLADYPVRRMDPLDEIDERLTNVQRGRSLLGRNSIRARDIANGIAHLRARA